MLNIGDSIPNVTLADTEAKAIDLQSASKGRPVIIAFFPGAFTGVCTKEMCTFRDGLSELRKRGELFAISVDGPFANNEFKQKNRLSFPVLSDYKREAIRLFGVELENFAFLKGYTAAKRAVFIADSKGVIKYRWVAENPMLEPNYKEIESAMASIS